MLLMDALLARLPRLPPMSTEPTPLLEPMEPPLFMLNRRRLSLAPRLSPLPVLTRPWSLLSPLADDRRLPVCLPTSSIAGHVTSFLRLGTIREAHSSYATQPESPNQ